MPKPHPGPSILTNRSFRPSCGGESHCTTRFYMRDGDGRPVDESRLGYSTIVMHQGVTHDFTARPTWGVALRQLRIERGVRLVAGVCLPSSDVSFLSRIERGEGLFSGVCLPSSHKLTHSISHEY